MAGRRPNRGVGGGVRYRPPFYTPDPAAHKSALPPFPEIGPMTTRSPLTDTFPTFKNLRTSARLIPNPPAGMSFTGQMAVFPLINKQVNEIAGDQDMLLASVHAVLGSSQITTAQGAGAWGTLEGIGAAVVVGTNISWLKPATGLASSWSVGVLPVGWIDAALPAATPGFSTQNNVLIWASPFAPGNRATSPSRVDPAEDFPPHVHRLSRTDRIQAAFVLNATQANAQAGQAGLPFNVMLEMRLRLGYTFTLEGLANT